MDENKPIADALCRCCLRKTSEKGIEVNNRLYCDEEHALVDARYLRLCEKAIAKAKRYDKPGKKGEVDYRIADFYLTCKLKELYPEHPLRLLAV